MQDTWPFVMDGLDVVIDGAIGGTARLVLESVEVHPSALNWALPTPESRGLREHHNTGNNSAKVETSLSS